MKKLLFATLLVLTAFVGQNTHASVHELAKTAGQIRMLIGQKNKPRCVGDATACGLDKPKHRRS